MIANMIKFETRGQGVSKTDLPGKGEELLLTDNTFVQWQARTKNNASNFGAPPDGCFFAGFSSSLPHTHNRFVLPTRH